jgi:hypothetical protein
MRRPVRYTPFERLPLLGSVFFSAHHVPAPPSYHQCRDGTVPTATLCGIPFAIILLRLIWVDIFSSELLFSKVLGFLSVLLIIIQPSHPYVKAIIITPAYGPSFVLLDNILGPTDFDTV